MEELEQALREKGLLDGRDIKDIVAACSCAMSHGRPR
jgi:transcription initiation factor TFIIIB Brf1 subunit/transcription initiation factor TFIIB